MKAEAVQPDKEGGYWQVVEKGLIFGGSAVCRLPFFFSFKKRPSYTLL